MSASTGEPPAVDARRSTISSRSKRAAGKAAPAPRRSDTGDIRNFMQTAVTGLAAEGKARIDRLFLDGPRDRRHHRAQQRRDRLVLEDRL